MMLGSKVIRRKALGFFGRRWRSSDLNTVLGTSPNHQNRPFATLPHLPNERPFTPIASESGHSVFHPLRRSAATYATTVPQSRPAAIGRQSGWPASVQSRWGRLAIMAPGFCESRCCGRASPRTPGRLSRYGFPNGKGGSAATTCSRRTTAALTR